MKRLWLNSSSILDIYNLDNNKAAYILQNFTRSEFGYQIIRELFSAVPEASWGTSGTPPSGWDTRRTLSTQPQCTASLKTAVEE